MQTEFKYIPERNKIGAVIKTTDSVERFGIIKKAVDNLLALDEVSLIYIMIYKPEVNGGIRKKLIEEFGSLKKRVQFYNIESGNFFSDIFNFAINEQTRHGVDYSLIISPEAHECITRENFDKFLSTIKDGALATCLEINEYSEIMNKGYFHNAFTIYRNTVINFVDIWNLHSTINKDEVGELNFGIEGMYAAKYLIDTYGNGAVRIAASDEGKLNYAHDDKSQDWLKKSMETKMERVEKMQEILKIDAEKFKNDIVWE